MRPFYTAVILICVCSSLVLGVNLKRQDSKPAPKPNFTGTWKLSVEKSDFGPTPPVKSRVDKIEQQGSSLKVTSTRVDQDGKEDTINLSLTIGETESANTVLGAEIKSKLKWDGATLLIDSTIIVEANKITFNDKWTLSQDGQTLTIARHYSGPEGEADVRFVLEKA